MSWWLWRGVRRGIVTTRYPDAAEPSTSTLPTPPVFRADLLTVGLVDRLVAVCPSRALNRNDRVLRYDIGACTACGRCLTIGGEAVRPSGTFELAVRERADLVRQLPIREEAADAR